MIYTHIGKDTKNQIKKLNGSFVFESSYKNSYKNCNLVFLNNNIFIKNKVNCTIIKANQLIYNRVVNYSRFSL